MEMVVVFLVGVFVGAITKLICTKKHGVLHINRDGIGNILYRFSFDDLDNVPKQSQVILKVENHIEMAQK